MIMPKDVSLIAALHAGANLFAVQRQSIPSSTFVKEEDGPREILGKTIAVQMEGSHMTIFEDEVPVFTMKEVSIETKDHGLALKVDYPKVKDGQEGRNWGILGMFLALYYGVSQKCTTVRLGSQIEITTVSTQFWGKFGIGRMEGTPLDYCLKKGTEWVISHCDQEEQKFTHIMINDKREVLKKTVVTKDTRSANKEDFLNFSKGLDAKMKKSNTKTS
jgi:hypothetical protein